MKNTSPSSTEKLLHLNYTEENKIWLTEQNTLRKLVGILGLLLPIFLFVFLFIDNGHARPLESISHYYYTRVCSVFVIIISLLAIFLLVYKGKEAIDFYISSIAGIFALCVALFPTSNITNVCLDPHKPYSVTLLNISPFRYLFHYIAAAIFLVCLAFISLFLFTRSDKSVSERSANKKLRNKVYRVCGVIMVLALLIIFAGFLCIIPDNFYKDNHLTFWMESVAVWSFGISWLTKAELFLKG